MQSDPMVSNPLDIPRVIEHATTRIQMEILQQKGIGDLRILSQSKFLLLVRKIVEATVEAHLASLEHRDGAECRLLDKPGETEFYFMDEDPRVWGNQPFPETPDHGPDETPDAATESPLRLQALDGIESRLASLDEAVQGMEDALGGLGND